MTVFRSEPEDHSKELDLVVLLLIRENDIIYEDVFTVGTESGSAALQEVEEFDFTGAVLAVNVNVVLDDEACIVGSSWPERQAFSNEINDVIKSAIVDYVDSIIFRVAYNDEGE